MANSVGRLIVELAASTAKFQTDLGKAAREAEIASKRISSAFRTAQNVAAGIGVGLSVRAFAGLIQGSIDAADHLHDLSQRTGVSVETLSGLGLAAKQSGTDLDSVGKAIGKLNVQTADAVSGNLEAARAFKAVGISLSDLKNLTPEEVLARVADRFAGWTDGANKAAIGNRLFGKSYQEVIPLLNQGGEALRESAEYAKRYGGVTTDVARQADEFNDTVEKLKFQASAFGRTLAAELLPSLQALSKGLLEAQENGNGFKAYAQDAASVIRGVATVAVIATTNIANLGRSLGSIAAAAAALAQLDFARAAEIKRLSDKDEADAFARMRKLLDAINNPPAATVAKKPSRGAKTNPPSLGSADAEDTAKKILDGQIKALERSIKDEEDTLSARQSFLQTYYQDGYLSIKDYYSRRQEVIDAALASEIAAYDREIAALQAFAAKANPKDRVDAENRIAEAVDKRAAAQRKAAIASNNNFLDETRAAKEFGESVEQLSIQLASLKGDTVTAATAGFDFANRKIREQINNELNSTDEQTRRNAEAGLRLLAGLRERTIQQAQLNQAQEDFGIIVEQVGNAQQRIDIQRRSGNLTELEALQQTSDANRARISELQRVADAYEQVARASGDPRALQAADNLRLKIEDLAASTDLVAKKFNDLFTDAFSNAISDFATGAKSLKDTLKDLAKSLEQSITKIAAQNVAESLFKPSGALGGVGGFFAKIFGFGDKTEQGGVAAAGTAPLISAGTTLTGAGSILTGAGTTLTAAAASLQAAAAALSAGSFGAGASAFIPGGFASPGIASDIFSFFGFPNGGSPPLGKASLVGERGPELFVPRQSGDIIPTEVLNAKRAQRGNFSQTVNITVAGGVTSATANQIAVETAKHTRRALAKGYM